MDYYNEETAPQEMPMKWYKFIIYFQLFVSALSYLFAGLSYALGWQYGGMENMAYAFWGTKLKVLDIFMAVLNFGIMGCMLYTRHCLTMYKKGAPKKYLCCLVLAMINALVYLLGSYFVTGVFAMTMTDVMMFVEAGVMFTLNYVYFKKREHLFVY